MLFIVFMQRIYDFIGISNKTIHAINRISKAVIQHSNTRAKAGAVSACSRLTALKGYSIKNLALVVFHPWSD